ncbi:MAG: hypothetical protein ACJ741_07840 [Pyrinomonadaceae bacterium]
MKSLSKLCAVSVLILVLTQAAAADDGIIHGDRTPPPPSPPPTDLSEAPAPTTSNDELTPTDIVLETVQLALGAMLALY